MRRLANKRELYSALLMMLIGIGTVVISLNYRIKTLANMGPGYFPLILGVGLILVSILIIATSAIDESKEVERQPVVAYRPWLFVASGIVAFIVLGKYGGLIPATFILVFLSALGDRANSIKAALVVAAVMTVMGVAVFHYGLQIQFALFTWG